MQQLTKKELGLAQSLGFDQTCLVEVKQITGSLISQYSVLQEDDKSERIALEKVKEMVKTREPEPWLSRYLNALDTLENSLAYFVHPDRYGSDMITLQEKVRTLGCSTYGIDEIYESTYHKAGSFLINTRLLQRNDQEEVTIVNSSPGGATVCRRTRKCILLKGLVDQYAYIDLVGAGLRADVISYLDELHTIDDQFGLSIAGAGRRFVDFYLRSIPPNPSTFFGFLKEIAPDLEMTREQTIAAIQNNGMISLGW